MASDPKGGASAFVERLGLYYESYGVPRIGGRMLGLLLLAEAPLDADAIVAGLAVSRASVSTNLRLLVSVGLVAKVPSPASRKDLYDVAPDAWEKAIRLRAEGFSALEAIASAVPQDGTPAAARAKLSEMRAWIALEKASQERALAEWRSRPRD